MKTVRDACVLQPNALEIRVSDQIEQLDQIIAEEGDGRAFFDKTHITQGMRALIHEGFARLAGKSTQAVFHLKQAMGGGKTHLMVGFGLLARHEKLRTAYCSDVPCQKDFKTARVAAFNGRNTPDHYFWGEIAHQLDRPEVFKKFWESGPKAPDEKAWLALFDVPEPVLILLDEMPPYFHYLDTQKIGGGTVADVATRAFAGLLTAAGKKKNVCIVVSDLTTTYDTGLNLINRALRDATAELGRAERNITPVDLAGNEIYDILRKRLFKKLPADAVIGDVSSAYGKSLSEATKAKVISRSAEAIADEIASTYPFHPRLKNLVALFKENEKFKQTRGLMELTSRLLKSVWERKDNDVHLIGPQHFDLSIPEVREKIAEISEMRDVIAKDLWDVNSSAHAQIIDLNNGNDAAAQVGALLLTASLSTAVNAVKGLTREEMLECLVGPLREAADFTKAFEVLETQAWYLHHTPEEKYYFDRQENLTKLLQSIAQDAPENQVEGLIRDRLTRMFKPARRTAYSDVLPLPKVDDIVEKVRKERVLLIISPDSKIPPEEVARLFSSLTEKNNVCVLTGDKTQMGSVEKAARQVFAAEKAEKRIDKIHPQREELERKQGQFEQDLNTTILSLFDKVLHPVQRADKPAELRSRPLDMTRDTNKPFNGEEQVEKTLTGNPIKLILDVGKEFDAIRSKAEDLLWPMLGDDVRWNDAVDAAEAQAGMYWLPPKGLEQVKTMACTRGLWEDLGNGYVTKKPKKKKTSVQVSEETQRDDAGVIRLRVNPQNAGPAPKIHYAEDSIASTSSPVLSDTSLATKALRVSFLVVDPSSQFDTGDVQTWVGKPVLRNRLDESGRKRKVELFVAPKGNIRYTLDGSEPRNGTPYSGAFEIGNGETRVLVFAEADKLEAKAEFRFPAKSEKGAVIDDAKPAVLVGPPTKKRLDSREKTFRGLTEAKAKSVGFEQVDIMIGSGTQVANITLGEFRVEAEYVEKILESIMVKFDAQTPVTLRFRKAYFNSGHDLKQFAETLGIEIGKTEVEQ